MSYKCLDCGMVFDRPKEEATRHGFDYGEYDVSVSCPFCNGNFTEMIECPICHEEHLEEDTIYGGVCKNCFDFAKKDFDTSFCIGSKMRYEIELNGVFTECLSSTKIEAILYNYIKENMPNFDCSNLANVDDSGFCEHLIELERRGKE